MPMCTSCHARYDRGIPDGQCGNGHTMTEANTRLRGGRRKCVDCERSARRKIEAAEKAARHADPRFTGGRYRKETS